MCCLCLPLSPSLSLSFYVSLFFSPFLSLSLSPSMSLSLLLLLCVSFLLWFSVLLCLSPSISRIERESERAREISSQGFSVDDCLWDPLEHRCSKHEDVCSCALQFLMVGSLAHTHPNAHAYCKLPLWDYSLTTKHKLLHCDKNFTTGSERRNE